MDTKRCLICAEHKAPDAFSKLLTGRDGLHPWCRDCLNQYFRDRRAGKETRKRQSGLYSLVHTATGHAYVGISKDLEARLLSHLAMLRKGTHPAVLLRVAYNKTGQDGFQFKILAYCPEEELEDLERALWERRMKEGTSLNGSVYARGKRAK